MDLPLDDFALIGAYLLLLELIVVQHHRDAVSPRSLLMYLAMCLVWLGYGLLQLSSNGPVATGTPLNYVLDGSAVVVLLAGNYLFYRWWRSRDGTGSASSPE